MHFGYLLTLYVTPANEQERDLVALLTQEVAAVTGQSVSVLYANQVCTGTKSPPTPGPTA